jgi:hypothetical protein
MALAPLFLRGWPDAGLPDAIVVEGDESLFRALVDAFERGDPLVPRTPANTGAAGG